MVGRLSERCIVWKNVGWMQQQNLKHINNVGLEIIPNETKIF